MKLFVYNQAARMGHMGMIKWLGERGADVSAVDTYGKTPSHLAAWVRLLEKSQPKLLCFPLWAKK